MDLDARKQPFFSDSKPACALRGHWVSFCLVDELGVGTPYGGLRYTAHDSAGQQYKGRLNGEGFAKLQDIYCGPVVLVVDDLYSGTEEPYRRLMTRHVYKLPITELQIRAEQTRFASADGQRIESNPARQPANRFYQVEVRDLVRHVAHLPPIETRMHGPQQHALKMMADLGFGPPQPKLTGIVLFPNNHTVLEVRPLRALRPMLSVEDNFCALNLYQLSLFAALSYCDFGQQPAESPVDKVSFPLDPSIGNLFAEQLAGHHEAWRIDPQQEQRFYPLYEEVPYSRRFEILPFDPELYPQNRPELEDEQEHPARLHFFDDEQLGTDTQAFITHHDEVILIAVRGTASAADGVRDANAHQVAFADGVGKAHEGFYQAYRAMRNFVLRYLDQFHVGQRIVICGHSLGGAIALLLAEGLRRMSDVTYNVLLYTYGAPRARAVQLHGDMPGRDHLFRRLFQASQHFMTASYIPAAWATLRRWQQTLESNVTLVTPREFALLDLALETMRQQLRDKRLELARRGPANDRAYEHHEPLNAEIDRLHTSRERLQALRWRRLEARDVYGSHPRGAVATRPQTLVQAP